MTCRHCNKDNVSRPRGLCWSCYYRPGVRQMYPSTSKFGNRGIGHTYRTAPLPTPTHALPGTAEKLEVLEKRAAAGFALFHPDDPGTVALLAVAS
jgi:hypothetical protein